ncbi:MAG: hypothetical protein BBJ60_09070 [Desulfobacterales bacterium S7086C20]|jgi:hypothetical protein|nr:MAG: hypothetical protein BBJ60_09070 [Desulfobacterales bacterium S7086C20]
MANHRNLRTVERKGHHGFFIKSSYVKALEVDKQDFEIFVYPNQLKNTPRPKELKELNRIRGIKRIFKT